MIFPQGLKGKEGTPQGTQYISPNFLEKIIDMQKRSSKNLFHK